MLNNGMFNPDFDPQRDLEVATHNIHQLIQAYQDQRMLLNKLIERGNQQDSILLDLTNQHQQMVRLLAEVRVRLERQESR